MQYRSVLALVAVCSGCSLARSAVGVMQGFDSGPGPDAFVAEDAFVGEDAFVADAPPDTGPPCSARCLGDTLVTCPGDVLTPCGAGRCDSAGLRCLECAPGSVACSGDGTAVVACDAEGAIESTDPCELGCSGGACRAPAACSIGGVETLGEGSFVLDLCGEGDQHDPVAAAACPLGGTSGGEDRVYRIALDRARTVRIDVSDVAGDGVLVDPVAYLLAACDFDSSQVACNDSAAITTRDARLVHTFGPGELWLIVDSYDRRVSSTDFQCGPVTIAITYL